MKEQSKLGRRTLAEWLRLLLGAAVLFCAASACVSKTAESQAVRDVADAVVERPYAPWIGRSGEDLRAGRPGALEKTQCSTLAKALQAAGAVFFLAEGRYPSRYAEIEAIVPIIPIDLDGKPLAVEELAHGQESPTNSELGIAFAGERVTVVRKSRRESKPWTNHSESMAELAVTYGDAWGAGRPARWNDPRTAAFTAQSTLSYLTYRYALIMGRFPASQEELLGFFGVAFKLPYHPGLPSSDASDGAWCSVSLHIDADAHVVQLGRRLNEVAGDDYQGTWTFNHSRYEFDYAKGLVTSRPEPHSQPLELDEAFPPLVYVSWVADEASRTGFSQRQSRTENR